MKSKDSRKPRKSPARSIKTRTVRAARPKRAPRVTRLKIPPALLEDDAPPAPALSGPGSRYAIGTAPAAAPDASAGAELPRSYGTRQLFLTARDPRWLYAYWDFSREQLRKYNALSADGHLILRVYRGADKDEPISHIHLHPESRSWFVPVPDAGARYAAELGFRNMAGKWISLACSGAAFTPPDTISDDTSIRFVTIPPEAPFERSPAMTKGAARKRLPLGKAMRQTPAQDFQNSPAPEQAGRPWTMAQEKALADVASTDDVRRTSISSLEITELIRRRISRQVSSPGVA